MFPRTNGSNLTSILFPRPMWKRLSFCPKDEHINIKLDLTGIDVTVAETKPTYDEIKDYVFKEFGLKVSTLNIAQVNRDFKC